ncbi:hypothetical protein OG474_22870 [Kribbella sp. NBC_01505]|uniref:hypothetical protein n=1 Tax=Kribbella sp. NBC_01505 TaxID=2903580 RepID=UPI00386CC715
MRRSVPLLAGLVVGLAATVLQLPASAAVQPHKAAACSWVVNELPLPAGFSAGYVHDSDRDNSFAGYGIDAEGKTRPLVWHDGAVTVLSAPGGVEAVAEDVNSRGDVVGVTEGGDTPAHAILWRGGRVIELPVLPGGVYAVPTAMNNAGLIVGYAGDGDTSHAVAWSTSSPRAIRDLGEMAGSAVLTDVNEQGTVVGWTETVDGTFSQQAIVGSVRKGLTTLPGTEPGTNSMARAAAGRYIAGVAVLAGGSEDLGSAVRWDPSGPHALPGVQTDAQAVNDHGTVVGAEGNLGAVIWVDGQAQALPALPGAAPFHTAAIAVTNNNTAAGVSSDPEGHSRPVTWSCIS